MKNLRPLLLFTLLTLALTFRFWGIWWGTPTRVDLHPDEMMGVMKYTLLILDKVIAVMDGKAEFTKDTLDPVFLNYPAFIMYITAGICSVLHKVGLLSENIGQVYLVGRFITASFGAATCIVVFLIVEELGISLAGAALAGLWMALMPLHVWDSHVAVTDVLMTFWVTMTLLASLRLMRSGSWRDYLFAGMTLGLAVGSKYTAAMVVVAVVAGAFMSGRSFWHTVRGLLLTCIASLLFCFIVTPYSFIRLPELLSAMAFEHHHTMSNHPGFSLFAIGPQYHKYLYQLVAAWPFSLGFALYACAISSFLWILMSMNRQRFVLLLFVIVYFGVTGSWNFVPMRYYLPVLVVWIVFIGVWQGEWLASSIPWRRWSALVSVIITAGYTGVFTYQTTARFTTETRIEAGRWIERQLPKGGRVLGVSWNTSYLALATNNIAIKNILDMERAFLNISPTDHYDLIQITSLMYDRSYRDGNRFIENAYDRLRDPNGRFRLIKRFESSFINKRLYEMLDPMFEGYFLSPTIEFYVLKAT